MMILANYGIGSSRQKSPNSAKLLSKSLQIRNRAELLLSQTLKSRFKLSPEKRDEILALINNYYQRLPFDNVIWNKYQVKQCIVDSILLMGSKFNPYKARGAFQMMEQMLTNLVQLPWHKEFRKILTYSGLYRLTISKPLIGAEEVFKAAGFIESRDSFRKLYLPDEKMPHVDESESITAVFFDCLLAQVVVSNIIDVFESYFKGSKRFDEDSNDINHYSWIQAYFSERSHQTTDRACSSVHDLLNSIPNIPFNDQHRIPSSKSTESQISDLLPRPSNSSLDSFSNRVSDQDTSHSDCEPLIPRYDRKQITQQQYRPPTKRESLYDQSYCESKNHQTRSNGTAHLGSSRHLFEEPNQRKSSSHQLSSSISQAKSFNSSKYKDSSHSKYVSRETEKFNGNRSYWSCGSCTYDNQVDSEICEMCRNRRASN